jgi:hypothetical protein
MIKSIFIKNLKKTNKLDFTKNLKKINKSILIENLKNINKLNFMTYVLDNNTQLLKSYDLNKDGVSLFKKSITLLENSETIISTVKTGSLIGLGVLGVYAVFHFYKSFSASDRTDNSSDIGDSNTAMEITRVDPSEIINNTDFIHLNTSLESNFVDNGGIVNTGKEDLSQSDELLGILDQVSSNTSAELGRYVDIDNKGGLDQNNWMDFVDGLIGDMSTIVENICAEIGIFGTTSFHIIDQGQESKFSINSLDPFNFLKFWDKRFEFNKPCEIIKDLVDKSLDDRIYFPDIPCTYLRAFDILHKPPTLVDVSKIAETIINMEGAIEYFSLFYASFNCGVGLDVNYIEIRALFSAVSGLTLYKLLLSNLPEKFYKKGLSTVKDLSFLAGFCIHDYFLLFKESFLCIISEGNSYYSPKNNALLTIKQVIFNKTNIPFLYRHKSSYEELRNYREEHFYYASMVYWLDHNHSISNALNLSRPSHFKRSFDIEIDCWKAVLPCQFGTIAFHNLELCSGVLNSRRAVGLNKLDGFPHHWSDISQREDFKIRNFKNSFFHRFNGKLFSSIQKNFFEYDSFSPMLKCLYSFVEVQKKNYRSLCISKHSTLLFRDSAFTNFLSLLKKTLPYFGGFFDRIAETLDIAFQCWYCRSYIKRYYQKS